MAVRLISLTLLRLQVSWCAEGREHLATSIPTERRASLADVITDTYHRQSEDTGIQSIPMHVYGFDLFERRRVDPAALCPYVPVVFAEELTVVVHVDHNDLFGLWFWPAVSTMLWPGVKHDARRAVTRSLDDIRSRIVEGAFVLVCSACSPGLALDVVTLLISLLIRIG